MLQHLSSDGESSAPPHPAHTNSITAVSATSLQTSTSGILHAVFNDTTSSNSCTDPSSALGQRGRDGGQTYSQVVDSHAADGSAVVAEVVLDGGVGHLKQRQRA